MILVWDCCEKFILKKKYCMLWMMLSRCIFEPIYAVVLSINRFIWYISLVAEFSYSHDINDKIHLSFMLYLILHRYTSTLLIQTLSFSFPPWNRLLSWNTLLIHLVQWNHLEYLCSSIHKTIGKEVLVSLCSPIEITNNGRVIHSLFLFMFSVFS